MHITEWVTLAAHSRRCRSKSGSQFSTRKDEKCGRMLGLGLCSDKGMENVKFAFKKLPK